MSIASSIPSIKLKLKLSASPPFPRSSKRKITVSASNAEGPIRRPSAPSLSPPPPPSVSSSPAPPKPVAVATATTRPAVVTMEYQRKVAKELQEYFREKKLEEADQGPFFGFLGKNEIANGRWAMFGFAVGLLTEYATGSDFVRQLKILFSNFGIVDLD